MNPSKKNVKSRAPIRVQPKLESNLAAYMTAAAAAGVGLLALSPTAEAKVIYTPAYVNIVPGYKLDLNHDKTIDLVFNNRGECASLQHSSICSASLQAIRQGSGGVIGASYAVAALVTGAEIGPAENFISYGEVAGSDFIRPFGGTQTFKSVEWGGNFADNGQGVRNRYIGIKFTIAGQTHYGWARLVVQIGNPKVKGFKVFLTGYAYETEANTAITAGVTSSADEKAASDQLAPVTPVQPSLGLLARGADSLAIWRREEEIAASIVIAPY